MNSEALSAALGAQASGLAAGPASEGPPDHGLSGTRPRLPAWAVLVLAVLLGAMAGAVAGLISTW